MVAGTKGTPEVGGRYLNFFSSSLGLKFRKFDTFSLIEGAPTLRAPEERLSAGAPKEEFVWMILGKILLGGPYYR